jgi:hypothetical protein
VFDLVQGVLLGEVEHQGQGDFKLEFVPIEGISRGQATAIGRVIPAAGIILGGPIGGALGWVAGKAISGAIAPITYTVEQEGTFSTFIVAVVNNNEEEKCLRPGNYQLEVKSEGRWSCNFIQPDLGQPFCPLTDENENDSDVDAGHYVCGPFTSGPKPILANIRHKGGGEFYLAAYSVDGLHQCSIFNQQGQFHVEDVQTAFRPGKEYMLHVSSDGDWYVSFIEGY